MKSNHQILFALILVLLLSTCKNSQRDSNNVSPDIKDDTHRDKEELNNKIYYPIRGLDNLGGTCYLNSTLHFMRKMDRRIPEPTSNLHAEVLRTFSELLDEFASPEFKNEVVSKTKLETFVIKWNQYTRKDSCKIVSMGAVESMYVCLRKSLGYEPKLNIMGENPQEGYIVPIPEEQRMGNRFLLTDATLGSLFWDKHTVGEIIKINGDSFKITVCEHNAGHKTAIVEDIFEVNGKKRSEFFHYDDSSVTWVPKDSPRNNRKCGGSVILVDRVEKSF